MGLLSWTMLRSGSQKYKVRTNLEVPWKVLFKPTLAEQNNFGILTLNRNGVSSPIESFITLKNFPISKILVSFLFFNMANLLQIKL